MLKQLKHKLNIFTVVSIIAGLLIVIPLLNILIEVFSPTTEAWVHIRTFLLAEYIKNTFILIFFVAIFSAIVGGFAAYVMVRYDFKGRKYLNWMLVLPLAVPSYIAAYIYADMTSYTGTYSRFMRSLSLPSSLNLMNMSGAVFIFVITLYPYVYMLTRSSISKQSASFLESARLLGASKWRVLSRIVIPLLRPALVAGTLLVVLETLNDYGVVAYFNVRVFSFAIFNTWFSLGDVTSAIRLSAVLMIIVFLIIFLERAIRGKRRYNIHSKTRPIQRVPLTGYKKILYPGLLWLTFGLGFIVPMGQLLWYFTLTFKKTFRLDMFYIIINSLTIAIFATIIVVIIAIMLANFNRGRQSSIKKSWLKITNLGYAIPGAVIAVAVNIFFIDIDRAMYPLYRLFNPDTGRLVLSMSLSMLIFAYVLRFMAIGYNSIEASYDKIGESFTEAAYVLKSSKIKTLLKIDLPLLKPGIISAAIIVFIDVIKELPLTLILRPANYDTLASLVYEYASDEMLQESSLAALVMILVSSLLIYILTHQKKKGALNYVRKD
ncbi:ABC transporter permease [Liberiplasma polymorphum]|uniref:ABC transporter permease n=1 Tax=Liberiplasma polymorphum TaxID=3374570 RepID=UPI003774EEF8